MRSLRELDGDVDALAWGWVEERARLVGRLGQRACRRPSPGHVHDLRVACRRLRAALAFFDLPSRGPSWEALDRATRKLAKVVAPLRELDVSCRRLAALGPHERREPDHASELGRVKLLARWRHDRSDRAERRQHQLAKRVDKVLAAKKKLVLTTAERRGPAWLEDRLARVTAEVRDASRTAQAHPSHLEGLHRARIAVKHLRYACELARSFAEVGERRALAASLETLQDRGGDLQDGVDLVRRLEKARARGHLKGDGGRRLVARALASRDAAASAFVAALNEAFPLEKKPGPRPRRASTPDKSTVSTAPANPSPPVAPARVRVVAAPAARARPSGS